MWKPIKIYKLSSVADDEDNITTQPVLYHKCKAEINSIGGKEYYAARQTNSENEFTFKIRFCRALKDMNTYGYSIEYDGKLFDIKHIDNYMMSNEFLKIRAVVRNG